MKYLIAIAAALFIGCVWATPAKAQCVNGNCAGTFQVVPVGFAPVQTFAFAPTNNVFTQRAFVPVPVRGFVPAFAPTPVGGFSQQFNFGRGGFNRGVQLNQVGGFAPRQTITNVRGPFGGQFTRIRQF